MPRRRWRTRADPVATWPCVRADDRAVFGHEAGSGSRAERRDQIAGGGIESPGRFGGLPDTTPSIRESRSYLPTRLDLVQNAVGRREVAVPFGLHRDADFNLRVHAGQRLGKSVDLVGEVLDFRDAEDREVRGSTPRWCLDWRRLRWLRRRTADHQLSGAVILQRTDRASSAGAVNEALTQSGIEAVQEDLRRPRPPARGLQIGIECRR